MSLGFDGTSLRADAPAHAPQGPWTEAAPPAGTDPIGALAGLPADLQLAEAVSHRVAGGPVSYRAAGDPPSRPPARHRRRGPRDLPAVADRLWRPPLGLAVAIFASCGPAHAFGYVDYVFYAVLVGLALSGLAVPLGLVALRHRTPHERTAADEVAAHPVTAGPEPGDPAIADSAGTDGPVASTSPLYPDGSPA